jgi:hypothetical protein
MEASTILGVRNRDGILNSRRGEARRSIYLRVVSHHAVIGETTLLSAQTKITLPSQKLIHSVARCSEDSPRVSIARVSQRASEALGVFNAARRCV